MGKSYHNDTYHHLYIFCFILILHPVSNMNSSISSPSPFEITYIKNAKVIKTEIKPFLHNIVYNYTQPLSFENEPYSLETIPFIRQHLDTYFSILDIDLQLFLRNIHLSKLLFRNKKPLLFKHTEEQ